MITQLCKLPDNRCIAPLKWVNVTVLKLYLDNTLKILWEGRRIEGLQPGKVDPQVSFSPDRKLRFAFQEESQCSVKTGLEKRNPTDKHFFTLTLKICSSHGSQHEICVCRYICKCKWVHVILQLKTHPQKETNKTPSRDSHLTQSKSPSALCSLCGWPRRI